MPDAAYIPDLPHITTDPQNDIPWHEVSYEWWEGKRYLALDTESRIGHEIPANEKGQVRWTTCDENEAWQDGVLKHAEMARELLHWLGEAP